MPQSRVLMVALDACDPVLIDRWSSDGTLPHILDLAPTVARMLATQVAVPLAGRVRPELVSPA